ncbi:MAG: hypothetical protein WCR31_04650, partial [Treponema sp.]
MNRKKWYIETRIRLLATLFLVLFLFSITLLLLTQYRQIHLFWLFFLSGSVLAVIILSWFWIIVPYQRSKHFFALFADGYS